MNETNTFVNVWTLCQYMKRIICLRLLKYIFFRFGLVRWLESFLQALDAIAKSPQWRYFNLRLTEYRQMRDTKMFGFWCTMPLHPKNPLGQLTGKISKTEYRYGHNILSILEAPPLRELFLRFLAVAFHDDITC